MKYLLTGAQGTGKTSIMDALSCNLQKLQNITRTCITNNNLSINENSNDNTQKAIFDAYYKALTENDNYVAERSLFDVYAYTRYTRYMHIQDKQEFSLDIYDKMSKIIDEQIELLENFIKENPDAIYFYIPIEFKIQPDGVRSTNEYFQKYIDHIILDCLYGFKVKFYKITGTVEERVKKIQEIIEQNNK